MWLARVSAVIILITILLAERSSCANELAQDYEMVVTTAIEAEKIVRDKITDDKNYDFVVQNDKTQEKDFGWVIFYTTRKFQETGDPSYLVPGVGLVVVLRDGRVVSLPSSVPPDVAINIFQDQWHKTTDINR